MTSRGRPIRVLLADDQVLFRRVLAGLIADWSDVLVVGEAGDGLEAVSKTAELNPDVVLLDINMPGMNGIEAARLIRGEYPDVRILILTVSEQDNDLFEAIKLGAHGYLLKDLSPPVLHEMLVAAWRGEAPISPLMARKMLSEFVRHLPDGAPPEPAAELTPRERQVLDLVAAGADNREIAERLCLVPGTVKRHLHNILAKLHAHTRREAVSYAAHHGLMDRDRG